eukprot:jgi/Mesvir1/21568/Mv04008-RA.1
MSAALGLGIGLIVAAGVYVAYQVAQNEPDKEDNNDGEKEDQDKEKILKKEKDVMDDAAAEELAASLMRDIQPKSYKDMTEMELSNELTKILKITGGQREDPRAKEILEEMRIRTANKTDHLALPSSADIAALDAASQMTGVENLNFETLSHIQRMYRAIFRYSASNIRSKLLDGLEKNASAEADRLRSLRDALAENSEPRKVANDNVNKFTRDWSAWYSVMRSYLYTGDAPFRSYNAMARFFIDLGVMDKFDLYVSNLYSFISVDTSTRPQKTLEWVDSEKFKLEAPGSKFVTPVVTTSDAALRSALKKAGLAVFDVEEKEKQAAYDNADVNDISGRAALKVSLDDYKRYKASTLSTFNSAVDKEPKASMFIALWSFLMQRV